MKKRAHLVLASRSEARQRLMKRLGVEFDVESPGVDETPFQKKIKNPRRLVETLAMEKARAVFARRPSDVVIGSDQMMVLGKKIFGQPGTEAKARAQLRSCSGKTISLLTAVCVIGPDDEEVTFTVETKMRFRKLSSKEISAYVAADRPLECAGSFKFESLGASLFESIEGDDPTAIEGLPILHLNGVLRRLYTS